MPVVVVEQLLEVVPADLELVAALARAHHHVGLHSRLIQAHHGPVAREKGARVTSSDPLALHYLALVLVNVMAERVPVLILVQLLVQLREESACHAVVEARLDEGGSVDEGEDGALLTEHLGLGWVQLEVLVLGGDDAVEGAELEALALHGLHLAREVEDEVIADAVGNLAATCISVPLRGREDDVHLLVGEVLLEELLVLEALRRAGHDAHAQRLEQDLHRHDRVGVAPVQHQHRLHPLSVHEATELEEEEGVDAEAHLQLRDVVELHRAVVQEAVVHAIHAHGVVEHLFTRHSVDSCYLPAAHSRRAVLVDVEEGEDLLGMDELAQVALRVFDPVAQVDDAVALLVLIVRVEGSSAESYDQLLALK
uniref:Uncharacterized protein n=1 Tax=Strombidium rassoulzadegani TaxID=1082188 RepID=A0A7S3CNG6_9SPIT|mmetsp:Transcript_18391/g.31438  ORF Transcript_18391/g.31438 Transcript_18391/m.31438 type:complete len:368 (+) Transcript_18391:151-1254(+)